MSRPLYPKTHYPSIKANTVRILERYNRALALARSSPRLPTPQHAWYRLVLYLLELGIVWLLLFLLWNRPGKDQWETLGWSLCGAVFFVGLGWGAIHRHTDSPANIFKDPELAATTAALNGATEPISLAPLAADCDALIEHLVSSTHDGYLYDEERAIVALIAHLQTESILARSTQSLV